MRVLVIEDEPKVADAIGRGLRTHGYAVDISADGLDALSMATEYEYDVIVLDLMIPGIDGVDVCSELRARGRWAPVLMLTARGSVQDRIRGLDAGADDYMLKPFVFGELLARLRSLIRGRIGERPVVLHVGDVVLDPVRHLVQLEGRQVDLSPREFAMIECLLRHKGQALTRNQLLDHAWPYDSEVTPAIVDTYVYFLRRKLGVASDRIETVRGVGYRMAAS